jgi:hypothetical protein
MAFHASYGEPENRDDLDRKVQLLSNLENLVGDGLTIGNSASVGKSRVVGLGQIIDVAVISLANRVASKSPSERTPVCILPDGIMWVTSPK